MTKATNVYAAITRAAHKGAGGEIDRKLASRYGVVLQWVVKTRGRPPSGVADYLRKNGGIRGCLSQRSEAEALKNPAAAPPKPRVTVIGLPPQPEPDALLTIKFAGGEWRVVAPAETGGAAVVPQTPSPLADGGQKAGSSGGEPPRQEREADPPPDNDPAAPEAGDGRESAAAAPAEEGVPVAAQG